MTAPGTGGPARGTADGYGDRDGWGDAGTGGPAEDAQMRPTMAFCERVTATPTSAEHIREVGPEGLKMGGGIPNAALCGYDVVRGWDLATPVTPDTVRALATPRAGDGHVFLCSKCAGAYLGRASVARCSAPGTT